MFLAFWSNNLFPAQVFDISRSTDIMLAPIIGGVGTLFGPVVGAAVGACSPPPVTGVSTGADGAAEGSGFGTLTGGRVGRLAEGRFGSGTRVFTTKGVPTGSAGS